MFNLFFLFLRGGAIIHSILLNILFSIKKVCLKHCLNDECCENPIRNTRFESSIQYKYLYLLGKFKLWKIVQEIKFILLR